MNRGIKSNRREKALSNLFQSYNKHRLASSNINGYRDSIEQAEIEIDEITRQLESEKSKLDAMQTVDLTVTNTQVIESQIKALEREYEEQSLRLRQKLNSAKADLRRDLAFKRDEEIKHLGMSNIKMGDYEQKALRFAQIKYSIVSEAESHQRVIEEKRKDLEEAFNDYALTINHRIIGIRARYDSMIAPVNNTIASIHTKWKPIIDKQQQIIDNLTVEFKNKEQKLKEDRQSILCAANDEIDAKTKIYREANLGFNQKVSEAVDKGKDADQLEQSKKNYLDSIMSQIEFIKTSYGVKLEDNNKQLEILRSAYNTKLEKESKVLSEILKEQDAELLQFIQKVKSLENSCDIEAGELEEELDIRKAEHNEKLESLNSELVSIEADMQSRLSDIESSMKDYILSTNTCFNEVLEEAYKPFKVLGSKLTDAVRTEDRLKRIVGNKRIEKNKMQQRERIYSLSYKELVQETRRIYRDNRATKVSIMSDLRISSMIALAIIISAAMIGFYSPGINIFTPVLIGAIASLFIVYVSILAFKSVSTLCLSLITLVEEYRNIPCIEDYTQEETLQREVTKFIELGTSLLEHTQNQEAINIRYNKLLKDELNKYKDSFEKQLESIKLEFNTKTVMLASQISDIESQHDALALYNKQKKICLDMQSRLESIKVKKSTLEKSFQLAKVDTDSYRKLYEKLILNGEIHSIPKDDIPELGVHNLYFISESGNMQTIELDGSPILISSDMGTDTTIKEVYTALNMLTGKNTRYSIVTNKINKTFGENQTIYTNLDQLSQRIDDIMNKKVGILQEGATFKSHNLDCIEKSKPVLDYDILIIDTHGMTDEDKKELPQNIKHLIPSCQKYGFLPILVGDIDFIKEQTEKQSGIIYEYSKYAGVYIKHSNNQYTNS